MKRLIGITLLIIAISGCESMPIKDGGVAIGKNSTATIDGVGTGKIVNKF